MTGFCVPLGVRSPVNRVGGKSFNLTRLVLAGVAVPAGFTISSDGFDKEGVVKNARTEVLRACGHLGGVGRGLFVRSSAIEEDLSDRSMAGKFTTVPGVKTEDSLDEAIRRCWLSMAGYTPAIIIQHQVEAVAAGVAFTAHPLERLDTYVVEANFGFGDSVVSGLVTPDRYEYNKTLQAWKSTLSRKSRRSDCQDGEWQLQEIPSGLALARVLSECQLRKLGRILEEIETIFDCPQDVEWCLDRDEEFQIVQSRPITTLV